MADRRIDQLTEAEDISDEDLFVIWKQNISQTRSIAKGTMNLASKDYVDNIKKHPHPDWANMSTISNADFNTGWVAPSDGMIILRLQNTSSVSKPLKVNDVEVFNISALGSEGNTRPVITELIVSHGDVVKIANATTNLTNNSRFFPWK